MGQALDQLGQNARTGDDTRIVRAFVDESEKMLLLVFGELNVWKGDLGHESVQVILIASPSTACNSTRQTRGLY